jgi:hypothetical protein
MDKATLYWMNKLRELRDSEKWNYDILQKFIAWGKEEERKLNERFKERK